MIQMQIDMILARANTAALTNFQRHGTADNVTARKVLRMGRITLHETFAFTIHEKAALPADAFGDQATRAINPGRMELRKFHILKREPGAQHHAAPVTGAGVGGGAAEIGPAKTACRQHNHMCAEEVE